MEKTIKAESDGFIGRVMLGTIKLNFETQDRVDYVNLLSCTRPDNDYSYNASLVLNTGISQSLGRISPRSP